MRITVYFDKTISKYYFNNYDDFKNMQKYVNMYLNNSPHLVFQNIKEFSSSIKHQTIAITAVG